MAKNAWFWIYHGTNAPWNYNDTRYTIRLALQITTFDKTAEATVKQLLFQTTLHPTKTIFISLFGWSEYSAGENLLHILHGKHSSVKIQQYKHQKKV